ncbi:phosphotransferase [Paenibacillus alkaliterrae]|uniref:phosphotransferase enzyme family protein n=1 Tax=Paenibacillus alkaliterrae TaxID=320909 RepID=UPI001F271AC2|nr:phosphotransferase [Paenibacillus alkaliterrae]MCF2941725.1 phosphotransferase [Paenibacillus alkaliterrae]
MTQDVKERWAAEIVVHLKDRFGLSVREVMPIDKGWLNVKWKMVTDLGPLFIKYYNPERYKLHTHPERRSAIEKTLQLQHGMSVAGIPCPKVYLYNGQFIQETPSGLFYTVLDWVDGHTSKAGCLNAAQMFELGVATGLMHKWLRSVPPLDKPAWKPDRDVYLREWQGNWEKAQEAGDKTVMEWLRRSQTIVKSVDFRMFESCPTGWLHWDLWVDNILLHGQGLAGIVDFDRMTMAYQEIDVARAVLSGALRDGQMRMETARAFMDGYRGHSEVSQGMLPRAMRMLYLIESIWWLRTEVRSESDLRGLLGRFIEEMHWIEDNWATLPEQLDTI